MEWKVKLYLFSILRIKISVLEIKKYLYSIKRNIKIINVIAQIIELKFCSQNKQNIFFLNYICLFYLEEINCVVYLHKTRPEK